jgi:hypothetical protein
MSQILAGFLRGVPFEGLENIGGKGSKKNEPIPSLKK